MFKQMLNKTLYSFTIATAILMMMFVLAPAPHISRAQSTDEPISDESIQDFAVDMTLNQDSSILVKEQIDYDFGNIGEHHGIFRNIPYKYKARGGTLKLRISDIAVTDLNSTPINFTQSHSGNDSILKIGDADVTVSGRHIYKISYTVKRAVNYFDDHDELYWNAIGSGWEVPILKASAVIHAPASITKMTCYTGPDGSVAQNCTIAGGNTNSVTFNTTNKLEPHEGLTIVVGMPAGTLTKPTTAQKLTDIFRDNGILILPLFVLLSMFYLWNRYGKDPRRKNSIVAQYDPPDKMSALYAGTLIHGKTTNRDIAAEVIYLAANGFLTIQRLETTQLMPFKGTDYEFTKLVKDSDAIAMLAPQSKAFLDELFPSGQNSVKLSELKKDLSFGKSLVKIKSEVMKELIEGGYYKYNAWVMAGSLVVCGFVIGVGGSYLLGHLIGYLGVIAAVLSGLIILGFSFIMPARTQKGADAAAHIEGLKVYLTVAEKDRLEFHNAPEKNPQHFELLLPFAIALGVEAAWAAQFKDLTNAPSWYGDSTGAAFNAAMFSGSMSDFSSSMQSVASSVTTASSGGSGFSGGGGGGGGGGGSW